MADSAPQTASDAGPAAIERSNERRKRMLTGLGLVVLLSVVLYGAYWYLYASHFVSTDNAYVGAETAQVTPLVSAPVANVLVRETQSVNAGDVLVELDVADARLAFAEARANMARAASDVSLAQVDLSRRQELAPGGAVSADELSTAQNAYRTSAAALEAARARVAAAQLALSRMTIRSPIAGVVSSKSVEVGQRVNAGQPLMVIAPIGQAYVNANFRETQLREVAIGQPVTLHSDIYGGSVVYHGRVVGLSGGTGAAFSLIPAQNASGNWIKVVQRVPVRIALDEAELRTHPLRVGMSMSASIDVSHRN